MRTKENGCPDEINNLNLCYAKNSYFNKYFSRYYFTLFIFYFQVVKIYKYFNQKQYFCLNVFLFFLPFIFFFQKFFFIKKNLFFWRILYFGPCTLYLVPQDPVHCTLYPLPQYLVTQYPVPYTLNPVLRKETFRTALLRTPELLLLSRAYLFGIPIFIIPSLQNAGIPKRDARDNKRFVTTTIIAVILPCEAVCKMQVYQKETHGIQKRIIKYKLWLYNYCAKQMSSY